MSVSSLIHGGIGPEATIPLFLTGGLYPGEAVIPPPVVTGGGGEPARRRGRYPRRVFYRGISRWLRNADEERRFLDALLAEAQSFAALAATESERKAAVQAQVRIRARLAAVDDRESQWRQQLDEEDELLLMAFFQ